MLGTLRTFTLVGLIANFKDIGTWIGETAAKLAGYKDRTQELEAAERAATAAAKGILQFGWNRLRHCGPRLISSLTFPRQLAVQRLSLLNLTNGSTAADALRKVSDSFDLSKIQGIKDFAATLDKLGADGAVAAGEFQAAWAKAAMARTWRSLR